MANNARKPRFLNADEAADIYGMRPEWFLRMAREGHLSSVKINRYVRFEADVLEAEMTANRRSVS